jgi:HAD superfamily hydrolase (TIGR01509 family)
MRSVVAEQSGQPRGESGIEAVVFDLDGVLVDTEGMWDGLRRELAAESGRPWPPDATARMLGMSTPEWSHYMAGTVAVPGTDEEVARTVIDRMAKRYAVRLPLIPGAVETVERLAGRWRLGLATSSPRVLIDAVLDASGLTDAFEATVSTEEVAAGKPSPAVYQAVIERLGVRPGKTVAIEDSSNGLRAAAAAGLVVVAVPNQAFPPAADALALARARVSDLAEITPELVESLAEVSS